MLDFSYIFLAVPVRVLSSWSLINASKVGHSIGFHFVPSSFVRVSFVTGLVTGAIPAFVFIMYLLY